MSAGARGIAAILGLSLAVGVAGCSSSHPPAQSKSRMAARYLAIAKPANHVLDESFDALEDDDVSLSAASGYLRTIARTERGFDRDLLAMKLPAPMGATATRLVQVNEQRAALTAQAMTAPSIASLKRDEIDLDAMNVPVEVQVRLLRKQLGLPPPDTD